MKLFSRSELTGRSNVVQSSAIKCGKGKIAVSVGVRLQEKGRLFRTNVLTFDGTDIKSITSSLAFHANEVLELCSALTEARDWCERRRSIHVPVGESVSKTWVVEQEWPTMFYAVQTNNRLEIHMYGRNLLDACLGFRKDRSEGYRTWAEEVGGIIDNFKTHLDEVANLKMTDLLEIAGN